MSRRHRTRPSPAPALPRAAVVPPLYHVGVRLFATFSLAMLLAFWPSYFSRLTAQPSLHHHAHGLAMTLWLGLLVAQAALIRSGRRAVHRQLGLVSYALVPVIVGHAALRSLHPAGGAAAAWRLRLFFPPWSSSRWWRLSLFALAMLYRAQPAVTPGSWPTLFRSSAGEDRLIAHAVGIDRCARRGPCSAGVRHCRHLRRLAVDWQTNGRRVFLVALAIVIAGQAAILTAPLLQAFGPWFVSLLLSGRRRVAGRRRAA
jgi:hypothetical protein